MTAQETHRDDGETRDRPKLIDLPEMGGDAACWLERVCPECGAINDAPDTPCWRCGRTRDDEDAQSGS
jgi:hypothetical protein